ncbi:MAG TPA: SCO family protein [Sphingomicrobium sp.]|jgi:protein SCO1/2
MPDTSRTRSGLKQFRLLLWVLVAVALLGLAALLLTRRDSSPEHTQAPAKASLGGEFTLFGGDGKPFSSAALKDKPYAIFFGFTRCGDVCPTTLSRLVNLRNQAGGADAFNIVFVTIDPKNDGPKEVGQYAELFNSPIIGLTGSQPQIDAVKKQYGIYAEPVPHGPAGQEMAHTGSTLLFDSAGKLAGTISATEPDAQALATLKGLS